MIFTDFFGSFSERHSNHPYIADEQPTGAPTSEFPEQEEINIILSHAAGESEIATVTTSNRFGNNMIGIMNIVA